MKPEQKLIHYILGNQIAVSGENESKQDQMRQQHPPIRPESIQQMAPIYSFGKAGDQMSNIGAIISFSLHDIGLLPDHFFGRSDLYFAPENFDRSGSAKPIIIHGSEPISSAKDHVDHSRAINYFRQPMAEFDARFVSGFSADAKDSMNMRRPNHEIEVFRVSWDPGVMMKRVGATEQERNPVFLQQIDNSAIERGSLPLSHAISARLNRRVRLSKSRILTMPSNDRVRIAAVSDLHYTKGCKGICQEIFTQASEQADVLLLCGDLTDYGLPEEAQVLADDLHSHARIPVIAVWGNHDFE